MQSNLRPILYKAGIIIFTLFGSCLLTAQHSNPYATIAAIPVPPGFHRLPAESSSFAAWLRTISLKNDRTVYLFDGRPKRNQDAQFAVLNISVGKQDLQQCADAVMRLRAEYLYSPPGMPQSAPDTGPKTPVLISKPLRGHSKPTSYDAGRSLSINPDYSY